MIEDLIFKGRSLDEALEKASNFFGVPIKILKYEKQDSGPKEVWIKLVENPILALKKQGGADNMPAPRQEYPALRPEENFITRENSHRPQPRRQSYNSQNNHRPNQGPSQQRRKPNNHTQRNSSGYKRNNQSRRNQPNRGPARQQRSDWKRADIDISHLGEFDTKVYKFVVETLKKMSIQADVYPVQDDGRMILNIDGPDRSILLNRKGEPLVAIQYLVNKIFMGPGVNEQPVFIDSMGYRIARDEELQEIAIASAEKVAKTGKEYSLSPMNPYERRLIHVALKDNESVQTVSKGDGYIKRVCIIPS